MMHVVYPGSFDPFTNGHLDVAEGVEAAGIDHVHHGFTSMAVKAFLP